MNIKTIIITIITGITLSYPVSATIWRVDNTGSPTDFTTLQDAHDDAGVASGDTLYVTGSGTSYGSLTLTKTLYIFGPGYFLNENPGNQASPNSAKAGDITFYTNSEGSLITGLDVVRVWVRVSNVVVKRNKIQGPTTGNSAIQISPGDNVIVIQNYVEHLGGSDGGSVIQVTGSNIIISNNYLYRSNQGNYSTAIHIGPTSSAAITHNVIYGSLELYNSTFQNNILRTGVLRENVSNSINNNLANTDQFGTANGNQENVDMTTVFVGTGSTDGQWQLATGSPALGAGVDGVDCGMFGGIIPYVLSGIPNIPAITFLNIPAIGSTSSGLPVHVKAEGNN